MTSESRSDVAQRPALADRPALVRPETRIRPRKGWQLDLSHVWRYRELLYFFVWRDVKVRYKQTLIGAAWAVLQPFAMMIAFALFFGRLAQIPSDGVPYPIFYYAALLPWTYFANAVNQSTNAFVGNGALLSKVYFPRVILPVSATISGLIDLGLATLLLGGLMAFYGLPARISLLTLPLYALLAVVTATALGMWLSALNAKYRDVRYAVPFALQLWLFASPVAYPSTLVPERWRDLYGLNPMAVVIEGFRAAVAGTAGPRASTTAASACIVLVGSFGALFYLRRVEGTLADVI